MDYWVVLTNATRTRAALASTGCQEEQKQRTLESGHNSGKAKRTKRFLVSALRIGKISKFRAAEDVMSAVITTLVPENEDQLFYLKPCQHIIFQSYIESTDI